MKLVDHAIYVLGNATVQAYDCDGEWGFSLERDGQFSRDEYDYVTEGSAIVTTCCVDHGKYICEVDDLVFVSDGE